MDQIDDILKAVASLYRKYGIKSVTMDDVARHLGISKKTLYQYVDNKRELVEKTMYYELENNNCYFAELKARALNAVDELLEVNRQLVVMHREYNPATAYDLQKYYPDLFKTMNRIQRHRMYEAIINNIRKGKKEGYFREELNEDIIARLQVSRFESSLDNEMFTAEEMSSPQFIFELMMYHLRGIANNKGIELLEARLKQLNVAEYIYGSRTTN